MGAGGLSPLTLTTDKNGATITEETQWTANRSQWRFAPPIQCVYAFDFCARYKLLFYDYDYVSSTPWAVNALLHRLRRSMPSFDTVLHNYSHVIFSRCWTICSIHNKTVGHLDALNRR